MNWYWSLSKNGIARVRPGACIPTLIDYKKNYFFLLFLYVVGMWKKRPLVSWKGKISQDRLALGRGGSTRRENVSFSFLATIGTFFLNLFFDRRRSFEALCFSIDASVCFLGRGEITRRGILASLWQGQIGVSNRSEVYGFGRYGDPKGPFVSAVISVNFQISTLVLQHSLQIIYNFLRDLRTMTFRNNRYYRFTVQKQPQR